MADSSFGYGVGNFLSAFTAARQNRDNKKLKDEMVKAQTKLFELQMKNEAARTAGIQDRDRMMTGRQQSAQVPGLSAPMWQQAPGPNGQPDPLGEMQPAKPMSLLDMIADPQGQTALLRSGDIKMSDLMGGSGSSGTNAQRNFEALNAVMNDPTKSPEEKARAMQIFGGEGQSDMTAMLEYLKFQDAEANLQDRETARNTEAQAKEVADRMSVINVRTNFQHATEIMRLQDRLKGTAQQIGIPGGDWMQIGSKAYAAAAAAAGFSDEALARRIADRDRLIKLYENGVIEGMDRMVGTGAISQGKYESLEKASANAGNDPRANALLLADSLEAQLWAAEAEGLDIPNRDEIEEFIDDARGSEDAPPKPVVDGPGAVAEVDAAATELARDIKEIAKMGAAELKTLASKVDLSTAPQEYLDAMEARWNEVFK